MGFLTESELSALLDAHDALVKACIDSSLTVAEFLSAYGDFPHNYALDGRAAAPADRAILRLFRKRIAFHLRVSSALSGLRSADEPADIPYGNASSFFPAVGLMRLRHLVARFPDFMAEPENAA
jgi:hypothetical protein